VRIFHADHQPEITVERVTPVTRKSRTMLIMVRHRTALAASLAATLLLSGCGLLGDSRADKAQAAGMAFLDDWQAGRISQAGARTSDPKAAEQALRELSGSLRVARTQLRAGKLDGCADAAPCVLPFEVRFELSSLGEWRYASSLTLAEHGGRWLISWAPSVLHPRLTAETRLRRVRELPERAPILDRAGRPLAEERPVVTVGVVPGRLTDRAGTMSALASTLHIDPAGLAKAPRAPSRTRSST